MRRNGIFLSSAVTEMGKCKRPLCFPEVRVGSETPLEIGVPVLYGGQRHIRCSWIGHHVRLRDRIAQHVVHKTF